jgi:uncharacterized protein RhaS with RHS repeats
MTWTVADRLGKTTTFEYHDLDPTTGSSLQTTITDAKNHPWVVEFDSRGRMTHELDPKARGTTLDWDDDNNVKTLTEENGAVTRYTYDAKTGYPLTQINPQEAPASTIYTYQFSPDGHIADLTDVTSAAGRRTHYAVDAVGNVTAVVEPNGTDVTPGGPVNFATVYDYDSAGRLKAITDANGHVTT